MFFILFWKKLRLAQRRTPSKSFGGVGMVCLCENCISRVRELEALEIEADFLMEVFL